MRKGEKPKLRAVEPKQNDTCDKKFGRVGEYAVFYVKSHDAPDNAQFLASQVAANGKVIWNFKDEHFNGYAYFVEVEGGCCICLVSKKGEVKKVISLDALHAKSELEEHSKRLEALAKEKIKTLLK